MAYKHVTEFADRIARLERDLAEARTLHEAAVKQRDINARELARLRRLAREALKFVMTPSKVTPTVKAWRKALEEIAREHPNQSALNTGPASSASCSTRTAEGET